MTDFWEAISSVAEVMRWRRKSWPEGDFIAGPRRIYYSDGDGDSGDYILNGDDVLATDWERCKALDAGKEIEG